MARTPDIPLTREMQIIRVLIRFWLRLAILIVFAAFSAMRFDQILTLLLLMSISLCAALAIIKREQPLAPVINHWDEAAAYAALGCLILSFDYHVLG